MTSSPGSAETHGSPEILITENGVPDDWSDSRNPTADQARVVFLQQHLRALHQAIAEGSRVRGYYAWSLLDNFEWMAGYSQRWDSYASIFDTFARTPKNSASLGTPPPLPATALQRNNEASRVAAHTFAAVLPSDGVRRPQ